MQYSTDGQTWNNHNEGVVGTLDNVFYSEKLNTFVANTDSGIFVSSMMIIYMDIYNLEDGTTWNLFSDFAVYSLNYSPELQLFYGLQGQNLTTSSDLVHWNILGAAEYGTEEVTFNAEANRFVIVSIERWEQFYNRYINTLNE